MDPDNGFDCSGFVTFLLRRLRWLDDTTIRHCNDYFDRYGILVHSLYRVPGDLVFFSRDGTRPTHVGILVSHDVYIHAPGMDGSLIHQSRLLARDIPTESPNKLYSSNPIGFKRPALQQGRWRRSYT